LEGTLNCGESSDQLNQRYLRGAVKTGCRAILICLKAAGTTVQDVDFLVVCTCTGYVCPDVSSRLIDLNMLAMTGGRERIKAEFCALLDAADYELTGMIPTRAPQSIIEAASKSSSST